MQLINTQRRPATFILETLNQSFNKYLLQNNVRSKQYHFSLTGNTIDISLINPAIVVFSLVVGDRIDAKVYTTDTCLVTEFMVFLNKELKIKREVLI